MTEHSNNDANAMEPDPDTLVPLLHEIDAQSNMVAAETTTTSGQPDDHGPGFATPGNAEPNLIDPNGEGPAAYSPLDMTNHNMSVTHNMIQQLTYMVGQMAQNQLSSDSDFASQANKAVLVLVY